MRKNILDYLKIDLLNTLLNTASLNEKQCKYLKDTFNLSTCKNITFNDQEETLIFTNRQQFVKFLYSTNVDSTEEGAFYTVETDEIFLAWITCYNNSAQEIIDNLYDLAF